MQAIEDGRFEDLPGSVYAIGFIRTYALYLNLDADELIRRFKNEQSGLTQRQNLVFPAPPPASRVSGVAIGLVALLLAAAAYGGWYYLSRQNDADIAVVAPVPDRFATLLQSDPPPETALTPEVAEVPEAVVPASGATEDQPADEIAASAPEAPDRPGAFSPSETVDPGDQVDVPPVADLADGEPDIADSQFPAIDTVGAAPVDEAEAATLEALVSGDAEPVDTAVSDLAAPPEPPAAPEATTQPAVGGVRIEMRATTDSWVLIRDASGDMIMTRVMTPGDSYQVPDEPGLTLFTGNAGGLEILVDGEAAPSLGRPGEVIRNISLDPDLLRDGRAVISQ